MSAPPAPRQVSALDVLRDRSSGTWLFGTTMAGVAIFLQAAALGKQIYDITDSELLLGLLGLVEFGPGLLLLPVTGSVADRFDRRRVAAIGLTVEALASCTLVAYALTEPTSAAPLFGVAAVYGTARAFVAPSNRAIAPLVAPDHGLPRVMAVYAAMWQIGLIVGPASSGALYDVDPAAAFVTAAVGFSVAAVTIGTLRTRREQVRTPASVQPSFQHALEGLRFVRQRPVLFGAITLDMFAVLVGGVMALLPAIAEDRLGVGNIGYGWLRAAPGIGAIVFAGALAIRPVRRHVGRVLLVAVAVFGAATVVLGLTRNYAVAFAALVVLAGADAISVFIRTTIVPLATPDHMRGRVSAVENVFIGASNELGAFESGVVSTLLGLGPAVVLGGAATIGIVGAWSLVFPALRRIDRFDDVDAGRTGGPGPSARRVQGV